MHKPTHDDNPFLQWVDLAQPRLGSRVIFATDDFFADKSRLIDPGEPIFIDDKYDAHGKWMDGWESRRKRVPGHDHCVIRLGVPGIVKGVDIDTAYFTGNFPPAASLEGCVCTDPLPDDHVIWDTLVEKMDLAGDSHHYAAVTSEREYTHLRLNIFPDGGIARLRVYGEIRPDWSSFADDALIDLLALEHGGRALLCNDEHYGSMRNLNAPGRGVNMGDGWETARRRVPGNDWVVLALGHAGRIERVEIDTAHFKGNYPDRVLVQAALIDLSAPTELATQSEQWETLLPPVKLEMDKQHTFVEEVRDIGPISTLRVNIFPDGGLSRVRMFGYLDRGQSK